MPTLAVSIEGVAIARSTRKTPKLLVRGRRRKTLQNALRAIKAMMNQDWTENHRSSVNNYTPYLICGTGNTKIAKAFADVVARMEESIAAKA